MEHLVAALGVAKGTASPTHHRTPTFLLWSLEGARQLTGGPHSRHSVPSPGSSLAG